jgi:hypothetical protein
MVEVHVTFANIIQVSSANIEVVVFRLVVVHHKTNNRVISLTNQ